MTQEERDRYDELFKIHLLDMTDEEFEEYLAFEKKIKKECDTAALNFFENYFWGSFGNHA